MSQPAEELEEQPVGVDTGTGVPSAAPTAIPTQSTSEEVSATPTPEVTADLDAESPAEVQEETPVPEVETAKKKQVVPPKPMYEEPTYQEVASDGNSVDVMGVRPPAQNALQKTANDIAMGNDIDAGHITPKTYSDLMGEKSTFGKLRTMFGLLVSGAGSGLTGQPNAVLGMMDKIIDRDIDAQKQSAANRLNWYNAAMTHEMNQAQMEQRAAETDATRMGTLHKGYETEKAGWENSQIGIRQAAATTTAKNTMYMAYLKEQQNDIDRMADGPAKIAAQSKLDGIKPMVLQKIAQNNQEFAHKKAINDVAYPHPLKHVAEQQEAALGASPINQDAFDNAIKVGTAGRTDMGNFIGPQSREQALAEKYALEQNRIKHKAWVDAYTKLAQLKYGGQVPAARVLSSAASGIGAGIGAIAGGLMSGGIGAGIGAGLGEGVGSGVGSAISGAAGAAGHVGGHAAADAFSAFERERSIQVANLRKILGPGYDVDQMLPGWNDSNKTYPELWKKGNSVFRNDPAESTQVLKLKGLRNQKGSLVDFPMYPMPKIGHQ